MVGCALCDNLTQYRYKDRVIEAIFFLYSAGSSVPYAQRERRQERYLTHFIRISKIRNDTQRCLQIVASATKKRLSKPFKSKI